MKFKKEIDGSSVCIKKIVDVSQVAVLTFTLVTSELSGSLNSQAVFT